MLDFLSNPDLIDTANALKDLYATDSSKQILNEQRRTNSQLVSMRSELKKASKTNAEILRLQISELEKKEEQKYYKSLSYFLFHLVEDFSKIDDLIVLNYFIEYYYERILLNLMVANDKLEEINDKLFTKQAIDSLKETKQLSDAKFEEYNKSELKVVDSLILDFQKENLEGMAIKKTIYMERRIKDRPLNSGLTSFWIILLGILTFLFLGTFISTLPDLALLGGYYAHGKNGLILTSFFVNAILFSVALFGLIKVIKNQKEWRAKYGDYKINQDKQRAAESEKSRNYEKEYEEKVQLQKDALLEHPMYENLKVIQKKHPSFEVQKNEIFEAERSFYEKWMRT